MKTNKTKIFYVIISLFLSNIIFLCKDLYADAPWYIVPVKLVKFDSQTTNIFLPLYGNEIRGVDPEKNIHKVIAFGRSAASTEERICNGVGYEFERINVIREGITTDDNLRLRQAPNLTSRTLKLLKKETTVYILCRTNQKIKLDGFLDYWYKIKLSTGESGWSFGKYIKMTGNISVEVVFKNKSIRVDTVTYFFTEKGLPYIDKIKVKKKYFLDSEIKYLSIEHISYISRKGEIRTDLGIEGYD